MDIQCTVTKTCTILALSGRLDATQAPLVQSSVESSLAQGPPNLVFDCAELNYAASMGLRCFIMAQQQAKARGGSLVFCGVNGIVQEVFSMSGLLKFFRVVENRDKAEAMFREAP